MEDYIVAHTYQINKPNGHIDFFTVYDVPESMARSFTKGKYPNLIVEHIETKVMDGYSKTF